MKEEYNKDMETNKNPGSKNFLKSNKNHIESHSNRLKQVEDRISGLKDKIDIKEKQKNPKTKNSRTLKGICKNSVTPSED
jgi:uncharacterized protein (DUF342 family)